MLEENLERPRNSNLRINILVGFICLLAFIVLVRLFYIQIFQHGKYLEKANAQQSRKFTISARRGEIYVQDGNGQIYPAALNQQIFVLAVDPKFIKDRDKTSEELAKYANNKSTDEVRELIDDKDSRYVVLNRKLSGQDAENIKSLKLPGVILAEEQGRNYPEGELFAHVTGYVNNDGQGQYGVEQYMNGDLSGTDGVSKAVTDSLGVPITSNENTIVKPKDGADIILTVDRNIQAMAAKALKDAVTNNKAESGSIIVMDPKSGAIRAMVNYPVYDPNNYQAVGQSEYKKFINSSITNISEPGSGFKTITMAAGLDTGKVTPDTKYEDTGEAKIDDRVIKNANEKRYGTSTMTDVIQKSLNTGVFFVLKQLGTDPNKVTQKGKDVFYDYIRKFGFGEKTGIELTGESKGILKKPDSYDVDYANMTFGQGISTTSLQLISAVSAIANGGTLYKPYVIDKVNFSDGESKAYSPKVVQSNVISTQAAASLSEMMKQVVLKGSAWPTRMAGYNIAGKTGTAQVPKSNGDGYEENKNIGSFVGFAPVEDPKFIMLVRIDYPKVDGFAEKTAVPAFAEIAKQLFMYYQIPPNGN